MQAADKSQTAIQLVGFNLKGQGYAVDIRDVQEIVPMREITQIPNAPEHVLGAINLRGSVIPVLSLRKRFSMDEKDPDERSRILIIRLRGMLIGFLVDSVSDVVRPAPGEIEPFPPVSSPSNSDFISGIVKQGDRLLILLDMDSLLKGDDTVLSPSA